MKVYRVNPSGQLIKPAEVLKRMALAGLSSNEEFQVHVKVVICYKISDDGTAVKVDNEKGSSMKITSADGQSTLHHFGLGEEKFLYKLFAMGPNTVVEEVKKALGFAQAPDKFAKKGKTPPPDDPGEGVYSLSGEQQAIKDMERKKMPVTSPKKVVVTR